MSNPNYANENGTWKNETNCYVKHNNNWVEADEGWKNINGTWTKFYDKYSTTTTPAPSTTTGYPTTTSTSTSSTEDPGEGDGGEGGTTTAGPGGGGGNNVSVTDCSGGTYIVDDYNMMTAGLSVGDIVAWSEGAQGGGGDYHCGTVAATGVSGTSTGTLDMDGFSDCAECNEYMGL